MATSRRTFLIALSAAAQPPHSDEAQKASKTGDPGRRAHVSQADLVYDTPVVRSEEGMPVGNGRMGTLVWTTPSAIRFQINRADVYANNSYTNSFFERNNDYCSGCAYVEIGFPVEAPFDAESFKQQLSIYDGILSLEGKAGLRSEMAAWPDGDVIAVNVRHPASRLAGMQIRLRMLRHASQYFGKELETFAREHIAAVQTRNHRALCQLKVDGKRILLTQEFREGRFYCKSAIAIEMSGVSARPEIVNETEISLTSTGAGGEATIYIASAATFDPEQDITAEAIRQLEATAAKGSRTLFQETAEWWHSFWSRSYIHLDRKNETARLIEQNYNYFLYVMGASSRGKFPPKFNGMLWNTGGDLRTWGAQHWFANLSCYYEALPATNHWDLMDPMFEMYSGMFEACAEAAKQQWGSQGIYVPETAYFDGLESLPEDIAAEMRELYLMRKPWDERSAGFRRYSEARHPHSSRWNWIQSGQWVEGHWVITDRGSGPYGNVSHIFGTTAKIPYLFWQRYEYTRDKDWLRSRAYPMLKGAVEFYRNHPNMRKASDGKYHLSYANSNESVWGARDTDEDISALRGVVPALLRASEILEIDAGMRPLWREFLENLAPLPLSDAPDALVPDGYSGPRVFVRGRKPAVKAARGLLPDANSLPAWFFDLCNPESKDTARLQVAHATFDAYFPNVITATTPVSVLSKLPIAAAILGRTESVRNLIPNQIRALTPERGTAYKNGGVLRNRMTLRAGPQALDVERLGRAAAALNLALLQSLPAEPGGDSVIKVFPAWPRDWDAAFSLLARAGFAVTSSIKSQRVEFVRLESRLGQECRLHNPWGEDPVLIYREGKQSGQLAGSILTINTTRGERIEIRPTRV
jgi:hypothetical protein